MHEILQRNRFLIRDQRQWFQTRRVINAVDPETNAQILFGREYAVGPITHLFRLTRYSKSTPFDLQVESAEYEPVLRVSRGTSLFTGVSVIHDEEDEPLASLQLKGFS
jgi:hypothetical protein